MAAAAAVQDLAKTDKGLSEALQAGGVEEEAADKAAHTADTTKETDAEDKGDKKRKKNRKNKVVQDVCIFKEVKGLARDEPLPVV